MEDLFRLIISNSFYAICAGVVCGAIVLFILKKIVKLFIYAFLFLVLLLAYVYYSIDPVSTIAKPAESAAKRAEEKVKTSPVSGAAAHKESRR